MNLTPELIWFLAGLALILAEFAVPGVILVFFGMGAWVVALALWLGWIEAPGAQAVLFTIASVAFLFGLRRFVRGWFQGDTKDRDASLLEEFIGKEVVVSSDIPGGPAVGKVELKGTEWNARCATPLAKGARAVVVARDGLVLVVA